MPVYASLHVYMEKQTKPIVGGTQGPGQAHKPSEQPSKYCGHQCTAEAERRFTKKLITKVFIFVLEPELLHDAKGTVNFKDHFLHNHVPLLRLPRTIFSAKQASRLQYGGPFV